MPRPYVHVSFGSGTGPQQRCRDGYIFDRISADFFYALGRAGAKNQ
jgi:hypothetical protein